MYYLTPTSSRYSFIKPLSICIIHLSTNEKRRYIIRNSILQDTLLQIYDVIQSDLSLHFRKKYVSMIRKYHSHKPQTTPWHREEEPLNHHETPGRQFKQSNQLSLPHQNDSKTRIDIKLRTSKHRTITDSHNGSNNKQKVKNKYRYTKLNWHS